MNDKKWTHAAWMAVGAAVLMPANVLLSFLVDIASGRGSVIMLAGRPTYVTVEVPMALLVATVGTAAAVLSLIALYRFRELLNERYGFHGIDTLVNAVIVTIAVLAFVSIAGRMMMALFGARAEPLYLVPLFAAPVMMLAAAIGITSILAGIRLFGLQGTDLQHLIRPYAATSIAAGACFSLIVLVPIGMLLLIAANVMLALTFFRAGTSEAVVEFV